MIYLDNSYLIEQDIRRPATTTGESEAATGLTGLTGWISATAGGAAIHDDVSVALTERSATAGRYYGILTGTEVTARLTVYAGLVVYVVISDGTTIETVSEEKVSAVRTV